MDGTQTALAFAVFFAAIVGTAGVVVEEAAAGDAAGHMMNTSEDGENTLNASEVFILWGHDPDGNLSAYGIDTSTNESVIRGLENLSGSQELAMMTDIPFSRPTSLAETWSKNDFKEWSPGGESSSRYPTGADLEYSKRGYIQDAHATRFATHPSTLAYLNGSTPKRYISPEGTVRGAIDYRIVQPKNSMGKSTKVIREIEDHSIESVCLLETQNSPALGESPCNGAGVLAQQTGTHTPELQYSSLAYGQTQSYTLAAKISTSIKITVKENVTKEVCKRVKTKNGFKQVCEEKQEWVVDQIRRESESVTVSDNWRATVYKLRVPQAIATLTRDGEMQVAVLGNVPINGYDLVGNTIKSPWNFYTARNKAWDTIKSTDGGSTSTVHSEAHPIQTIAFHSGGYYQIKRSNETDRPSIVKEINSGATNNIDPSAIPEDLQATVALNYSLSELVAAGVTLNQSQLQGNGLTDTKIRANPLVRGTGAIAADVTDSSSYQQVRKANLTLSLLEKNTDELKVKVILQGNRTGNPIDTSSRQDGYVTVAGKTVNTNSSGEAVVIIPRATRGTAKYHSASWWEIGQQQPYTDAYTRVKVSSSLLEPVNLLQAITQVFIIFFPLLLVAYALDGYWGLDLWPPWN